jgi:uncharacterized protein YjbI with pentapeptide repeats
VAETIEIAKIRTMQKNGRLTGEQAEELIAALAGEPEEHETAPGDAGNEGFAGGRNSEFSADHEARSPRFHHRSCHEFDAGWVHDVVHDVARGIGGMLDSALGSRFPRGSGGGNRLSMSKVDQPDGESYEFQGNRVTFSKIVAIRLDHGLFSDNAVSASTLHDFRLARSRFTDNLVAGSSLSQVEMADADITDCSFKASKLARIELLSGSSMCDDSFSGCSCGALTLDNKSALKDISMLCTSISGLTISNAQLSDCEFINCRFNNTTFRNLNIADAIFNGCDFSGMTISSAEELRSLSGRSA